MGIHSVVCLNLSCRLFRKTNIIAGIGRMQLVFLFFFLSLFFLKKKKSPNTILLLSWIYDLHKLLRG